MMKRWSLTLALGLAPLVGCRAGDSAEPYQLVGDVQQLMLAVVEPSAEVYWDAVGSILDDTGTHDFAPATDEEWEAVRNAAFVVAESGNLLLMPGRAIDDGPWRSYSLGMIEAARNAIEAADARDSQAVFDRGADLYYACTACHAAYALETIRPNTVVP